MSKTKTRYKKPVLPIYIAALAFLVCSILFPIYRLGFLILAFGLSIVTYLIFKKLTPMRVETVEVAYETGDDYTDAILADISKNLGELHQLNMNIPDDRLTDAMNRMEKAGEGIVSELSENPDKVKSVTRFANYYLPEINKIMKAYADMSKKGVKGTNADQILAELHNNAEQMATAFENQLDSLYSKDLLNISTDIEVLDNIFKSQNLLN